MHLEILNEKRKYELFEQKVFVVTSSPRLNLESYIPATPSCSSQSILWWKQQPSESFATSLFSTFNFCNFWDVKFIHRRTPWKSPPFGDVMFHASFPYKFLLIRRKAPDFSITLPLAFGLETVFVNFRAADKIRILVPKKKQPFLLEKGSSIEDTMDDARILDGLWFFVAGGPLDSHVLLIRKFQKAVWQVSLPKIHLEKNKKNIKQQLDA